MPRSHICPSCLTELARIRAIPDEHYGLPIVVCPGCQMASVRTRHPDQQFWRRFHRLRRAFHDVVHRVLLTLLMGLILWGLGEWSVEVFSDHRLRISLIEPYMSVGPDIVIGAWLIPVFALGVGCVIRLLFWHHKAWVGALVFFWCSAFLTSLQFTTEWVIGAIAFFGGFDPHTDVLSANEIILRGKFFMMLWCLVLFGILLSTLFGRSFVKTNARRFRKLRKKLLKRRAYGS